MRFTTCVLELNSNTICGTEDKIIILEKESQYSKSLQQVLDMSKLFPEADNQFATEFLTPNCGDFVVNKLIIFWICHSDNS